MFKKGTQSFFFRPVTIVYILLAIILLELIVAGIFFSAMKDPALSPLKGKPSRINVCDPSTCHDTCNSDGSLTPCGCSIGGCTCQSPKSQFCPAGTGTCLLNPEDGTGYCYLPEQIIRTTNYCCKCGMGNDDYGWYVNACPSSCIHIVGTEADNKCGTLATP